MKDFLSKKTEIASYFIWDNTRHANALDLWYCAEDIGFFLEGAGIMSREALSAILSLPKKDAGYIEFVRNIAFRIFKFTTDSNSEKNWFTAEKLLYNNEWSDAVLQIASIYNKLREGEIEIADSIRTEKFKRLFS